LLKLGVAHEQVPLLRHRLDVPSTAEGGVRTSEKLFDEAVLEAVKQFQSAHGVPADGVVGPSTRRMLNQQDKAAATKERIRLIELNMERWRWLPDEPEAFYVTVNVPEFALHVIADGKQIFSAAVVVGARNTQTPIFSATMEEIVFNPYWNVPNSIKTEELLPYMRGSDSFTGRRSWNISVLKRNNLRVSVGGRPVDPSRLDWNRIDIRSVDIYQPPGPDNVLGNLKFVFPNKHDVYMHDTPLKFLFSNPTRAESHGCVRLQQPDRFALTLLGRDQNWTSAEITTAIETGHDQRVALQHKVPVHITYFTLWVNDDGSISTFHDLYGHDARMAAALFGKSIGSAPALGVKRSRAERRPDHNRATRVPGASSTFEENLPGFVSSF
jgi:murein L,D-transpeptidase YcbB/YkuD